MTFFASASVMALVAWAAWALVTFEIGSRVLPTPDTHADPGKLLRTLGFAATPGLIQVLAVLPDARLPVLLVAIIWTLVASVVAVRQALDYKSTARALAVCGLGALLSLAITVLIGLSFSPALSGIATEVLWR